MKKNKIITSIVLFILFAAVSGAFGADKVKPSLPALPSAKVIAPSKPVLPSLPPVSQQPNNVYNYNPLGKPDPFQPFIDIEALPKKKEKAQKVESIFPLQRAAVESFKLVGIVGDQTRRMAVVEDAGKKYYPIFVGTHIGLNNGKVTEILADRVTVDELDGKKVKRLILKLRNNI